MAYWKPITITGVSSIVQNTNAHAAREWSEPAASEPIYAAMKEKERCEVDKDAWMQFSMGLADLNRHVAQLNFRAMDVLICYNGASSTLHSDLTLIKQDLDRLISIAQMNQ